MSSSTRRSSGARRISSHGISTPDKRGNPTVLARKKRTLLNQKDETVSLERVLGLTCVNDNGLAVSSEAKCIAYPAGCVVVLYYPKQNKQVQLINPAKKHISCVTFSSDGKLLATGECGHQPCVRVWDVSAKSVVSELQGHSFGICCVRFSPNVKHLVSMGYHHDMTVCLWNWRTGVKIASNKVSSKVCGVDFCEDGSYFVTVGLRHVRYWYIRTEDKTRQLQPLQGRSAVLGEHLKEHFVSVCCGKQGTGTNVYCVTRSGKLCMFNEKRMLDQFIELQVPGASCLAISEQYVFCGCSNGIIRLFDPYTLEYVTTLPKPHHLGIAIAAFDTDEATKEEPGKHKDPLAYPSTVAVGIDVENSRLSCIYNDHSLYVWDLRNIKHIGKLHSFLYHNACVWDIDVNPDGLGRTLPANSFATCSSDCTIRFWCLDANLPPQWKNIYSKELLRMVYTDPDTSNLKDTCTVPGVLSSSSDSTRGVRTLKFRPNGQQLAVGDRTGNLQLYDLQFMDKIREVEAHDSEILCVEFSSPELGHELMATASRDRLVHVFDVSSDYRFLQTLDEHSSAITAVKFAMGKDDQFQLISCGADKSIIFRSYESSQGKESPSFQLSSHIAGKATLYDMVTDVTGKFLATAGQDRNIRVYHIATGKSRQSYKASGSEEGTLIKVALDPSSSYVATSSSDKSLCLFDFYSGELVAKLHGHSEVITSICFSKDLRRIYTASGDGCILVWRMSVGLSQTIYDRLAELGRLPANCPNPSTSAVRRETYDVHTAGLVKSSSVPTIEASTDGPDFRISLSDLPVWSQKELLKRPSMAAIAKERGPEGSTTTATRVRVAGKWAESVAGLEAEGRIRIAPGLDRSSEERSSEERSSEEQSSEDNLTVDDVEESCTSLAQDGGENDEAGDRDDRDTAGSKQKSKPPLLEEEEDDDDDDEGEGEEEEVEEVVVYLSEAVDGVGEVDSVGALISPIKVVSPQSTPSAGGGSKEGSPEKDAGSEAESPMSPIPPSPFGGLAGEKEVEEAFVKTNFESLTTDNADAYFGSTHSITELTSGRLSISSKFLSKSLDRRGAARMHYHVAHPTSAPVVTGPPLMDHDPSLASPRLPPPRSLPIASVVQASAQLEAEPQPSASHQQMTPDDLGTDRNPTVRQEVDKARKRLEELGWSITNKEDGSHKVIAVPGSTEQSKTISTSKPSPLAPTAAPEEHRGGSVPSENSVAVDEKEGTMSRSDSVTSQDSTAIADVPSQAIVTGSAPDSHVTGSDFKLSDGESGDCTTGNRSQDSISSLGSVPDGNSPVSKSDSRIARSVSEDSRGSKAPSETWECSYSAGKHPDDVTVSPSDGVAGSEEGSGQVPTTSNEDSRDSFPRVVGENVSLLSDRSAGLSDPGRSIDSLALLSEIDQVQGQLAASYQALERLRHKIVVWTSQQDPLRVSQQDSQGQGVDPDPHDRSTSSPSEERAACTREIATHPQSTLSSGHVLPPRREENSSDCSPGQQPPQEALDRL